MRKKVTFIDLVLKHIDTSAMMDLLLRLISCVEPAQLRQEVLSVREGLCAVWLWCALCQRRVQGLFSPPGSRRVRGPLARLCPASSEARLCQGQGCMGAMVGALSRLTNKAFRIWPSGSFQAANWTDRRGGLVIDVALWIQEGFCPRFHSANYHLGFLWPSVVSRPGTA